VTKVTNKAIVIGGGIAGLATARGLLHLGWDVTIFERAPSFGQVGAGITLAPNAVRALDWLGLGQELRAKSMAHGEVAIRDSAGRWLLKAQVEALEQEFGVPSFALHRAELHGMLASAVGEASVRTGHTLTGLRDHDRPVVTVEGPYGLEEDSADLVVAADGIHSRVRRVLFPGHPDLAYAGYITWRGLVPASAAPSGSRDAGATETWGRGRRFGIVPLGDGQVYWYATASLPVGSHQPDGLDDLHARYQGWHDPIPALLAATPAETLLRHDIYHLHTPLPRYNLGRIVLIGDAAHAMTPDLGQGGCQALEDAVVLVDALSTVPSTTRALEHYDAARRQRAQKIARASALWGRVAQWQSPLAVAVRNTAARLVPPPVFLRASGEMLRWKPPGEIRRPVSPH
jgi:2-polyprenyl-6-methoxyphenol hydroxylase-like FAD-dependent oxidoreductase